MLEWITPEEGRKDTYNKLYLVYQPGYPLMIADWKTGHGYRDVRTGESIYPVKKVAYINPPEDEETSISSTIPMEWLDWRIEHAAREGFVEVVEMLKNVRDWWNDERDLWENKKGE